MTFEPTWFDVSLLALMVWMFFVIGMVFRSFDKRIEKLEGKDKK